MLQYVIFFVQVDQCLSTLQTEVENFVLRMAAEFPQRKEQLVFLINNYDMMLGVLSVRNLLVLTISGFFLSCLRREPRRTRRSVSVSSRCSMLAHRSLWMRSMASLTALLCVMTHSLHRYWLLTLGGWLLSWRTPSSNSRKGPVLELLWTRVRCCPKATPDLLSSPSHRTDPATSQGL